MKIIVNEKNKNRIEDAIRKAEGKSTSRTISADKIINAVEKINNKLGISKQDLIGVKAEVDLNAQKLPSAYKWTAMSTHFTIEGCASGWALINVKRAYLWQRKDEVIINLTDKAKDAIVKNLSSISV